MSERRPGQPPRPPGRRTSSGRRAPGERPYAARPIAAGDEAAPRARGPQSPLKRLEEEEKEQARRAERVHVGIRLTAMGAVVLALFAVVAFRLWSLQVLHSSSAVNSVLANTTRNVYLTPARGLIEARGGQVLVRNEVEPVVTLSRQVAATDPAVVRRLAVTLGLTVADVDASINDEQDSIYAPVPVAVGVSPGTIVYLSEHRSLFPGVSVSDVAERRYPYGDLAAQTLGYVGDITAPELKYMKGYTPGDEVGQSGLEAEYEADLRGHQGVRELLVDASGYPVGTKRYVRPIAGDDVVTNLDLGLQQAAENDLSSELSTLQSQGKAATSGAVVVEDPQNGAILAMASEPTYNPSWWVGGISEAHYREISAASAGRPEINRAIDGYYIPGSTFKIATATAALDDGLITPGTYVNDPGSFTIPNCLADCTFLDDESAGCGSCNVVTAIAMSDDVFFYTLGYWFYESPRRYGTDPIQRIAYRYGFGRNTGIDLPGALPGQVDSPQLRDWQHKVAPKAFPNTYYGPGDALETAFGQGETEVTPLQLADAYSTFANGGTRYAPEVANEIISPGGRVLRRLHAKVLDRVDLPPAIRSAMLQGFEQEVTWHGGTGYAPAQETGYLGKDYAELPIAGKTGTSQVSATNANDTDSLYVAFGPVSDPKYCIAAVIPNAGYGAEAAAPVVFRLFEYLIKHPLGGVAPTHPPAG